MDPFWNRPERLEWELQALESFGYRYEILSGNPSRFEQLCLRVIFPHRRRDVALTVTFPEFYPYFRFQIGSDDLELEHHQNPFAGWLCVIGRGTDQWYLKDSLAAFLEDRVPRAIAAGEQEEREPLRGVEQLQAEPFADYYPYTHGHLLMIDGGWQIDPGVRSGRLVLGVSDEPAPFPLKGIVREVEDDEGNTLASIDDRLGRHFKFTRYGRWLRREEPIREGDPETFFNSAARNDPEIERQRLQAVDGGNFQLVAILFPEEQEWRDGEEGTGWVAAARIRMRDASGDRNRGHQFIRVARVGEDDFAARIPKLKRMRDHRVAIVGLGCLGAPAAVEFARMGVGRLDLIDYDFVEPATTVRWPLGVPSFGDAKVDALAAFIEEHYPRTEVRDLKLQVGSLHPPQTPPKREWELIEERLAETSVIIDATAEHGVQRFVSEYARHAGIPYVWMEGRQGGWGGIVAKAIPGEACWACIETAQGEEELPRPPSASDEDGLIQPQGCGDPTFTGTAFDMRTISMSGVRMVAGTLGTGGGEYPDRPWNLEVISLRAPDGSVIPPRWDTFEVERREDCPFCGE